MLHPFGIEKHNLRPGRRIDVPGSHTFFDPRQANILQLTVVHIGHLPRRAPAPSRPPDTTKFVK